MNFFGKIVITPSKRFQTSRNDSIDSIGSILRHLNNIWSSIIYEVHVMAAPNWVVNSKYILCLRSISQCHRERKTRKVQDIKYLSSENFAGNNRKPNCLNVGVSYIYPSSFINLNHFQDIIPKANYPPNSNKLGFCRHFLVFHYHYWHN